MRILHVANFNQMITRREFEAMGLTFYDTTCKLTNGFIRNGHSVFQFSDREIARTATWWPGRRFGAKRTRQRFLETCEHYAPDLICLGQADLIDAEALRQARALCPTVRILEYNIDPLFREKNRIRLMSKPDAVDAIFVTTAGEVLAQFASPNRRVAYMPNPIDRAVETGRGFAHSRQDHDLIYCVGNDKTPRQVGGRLIPVYELARDLIDSLPEVRFDFHGILGRPPVRGIAYLRSLGNARMGLNLSQESGDYLYSSERLAQLTGHGLLALTDRASGFEALYGEDEIAFYSGLDDLKAKIAHYAADDESRRAMAEKGWRKSHAMFDVDRVVRYMLALVFDEPFEEAYEWPTATY